MHELATFSEEEMLRSHLLCSRAESRHIIDSPMKQGKKVRPTPAPSSSNATFGKRESRMARTARAVERKRERGTDQRRDVKNTVGGAQQGTVSSKADERGYFSVVMADAACPFLGAGVVG